MKMQIYTPNINSYIPLPYFLEAIAAGFPSPADGHVDRNLDLNEHLIKHPAATFFVKAGGDSMVGAGIHEGDLLIVDKSIDARDGSIIIAVVNGEFTVKRFKKNNGIIYLLPENPIYCPIYITEDMEFEVWGVVTNVIHKVG